MARYMITIETSEDAAVDVRYADLVLRDTDAHPDAVAVAREYLTSATASRWTDRELATEAMRALRRAVERAGDWS